MYEFVKDLFIKYMYMIFDINTMSMFEFEISREIYRRCPHIKEYVSLRGKEIHFDRVFFRKNNGVLTFIPVIFAIKENFFYDVYIDGAPVGQISFKRNLDPMNYGYIITTRSLSADSEDILPKIMQIENV